MQEFRHIEPEHGTLTEQVTGKFQRQFSASLLASLNAVSPVGKTGRVRNGNIEESDKEIPS